MSGAGTGVLHSNTNPSLPKTSTICANSGSRASIFRFERQIPILRRYVTNLRFHSRDVFGGQFQHVIAALVPEPRQRVRAEGLRVVIPHPPIAMATGDVQLPMKGAQGDDLLGLRGQ